MKPLLYYALALFATAAAPAHAATYICKDGDRAVYSSIKLNAGCTLSQMNGSSDAVSADSGRTADRTRQVWEDGQQSANVFDDIKIAPSPRDTTVTNTAEAAPPSLEVKIRNGQKAKKQPMRKPIVVPNVDTTPAKQQLSRNQILQTEIRNEQTALVRTRAQLAVAKKKGDKAKTARLESEIRDREASIRAIRAEMKR